MKMKILALIISLLVGSGAGIYANTTVQQNTGTQSSTPSTTVIADIQKSAATQNTTPVSAKVKAETAFQNTSSAPQSCPSSAVCPEKSSCASASVPTDSKKSSCASCPQSQVQSRLQSQTGAPGCSGSPSCSNFAPYTCGESLNSLLNSLRTRQSCGTNCSQTPSTSKPTNSSPASSSPASSSPTSTPNKGSSYTNFQNEVVRLVNSERTSRGLKALTIDSALTKTATLKSEDMGKLNYFSHTSPTYGSPFDMMKQFGITYRTAGENIAMGQSTPAQVMQGWMNSEGHRANILNSSFTKIGVGIAKNSNGQYIWTQQFIG